MKNGNLFLDLLIQIQKVKKQQVPATKDNAKDCSLENLKSTVTLVGLDMNMNMTLYHHLHPTTTQEFISRSGFIEAM